jgi:hypothetical protein
MESLRRTKLNAELTAQVKRYNALGLTRHTKQMPRQRRRLNGIDR